jgi:hypothetical protein
LRWERRALCFPPCICRCRRTHSVSTKIAPVSASFAHARPLKKGIGEQYKNDARKNGSDGTSGSSPRAIRRQPFSCLGLNCRDNPGIIFRLNVGIPLKPVQNRAGRLDQGPDASLGGSGVGAVGRNRQLRGQVLILGVANGGIYSEISGPSGTQRNSFTGITSQSVGDHQSQLRLVAIEIQHRIQDHIGVGITGRDDYGDRGRPVQRGRGCPASYSGAYGEDRDQA